MMITDVSKVVSGPNPHHVDARKVYDSPHAMAVVITLRPGESLKKHVTPVDVFFYVLEGEGVVEIGDERAVEPLVGGAEGGQLGRPEGDHPGPHELRVEPPLR
jgi:hypothetical protein